MCYHMCYHMLSHVNMIGVSARYPLTHRISYCVFLQNVTGREVMVRAGDSSRFLSLAEVEVYGDPAQGTELSGSYVIVIYR